MPAPLGLCAMSDREEQTCDRCFVTQPEWRRMCLLFIQALERRLGNFRAALFKVNVIRRRCINRGDIAPRRIRTPSAINWVLSQRPKMNRCKFQPSFTLNYQPQKNKLPRFRP